MTAFVATLGPKLYGNWDICKLHGVWGVAARGTNWRANVAKVTEGDEIFVWRGGKPNGFIARAQVKGLPIYKGSPGFAAPWPQPERYGAVVPINVVSELDRPESDTFNHAGRVGLRFGFNNSVLQHVFEAVPEGQARLIREVFPEHPPLLGRTYETPPEPSPVTSAVPFSVDPDLVDRGLFAHHATVDRLAQWVRSRGFEPRLPKVDEPQFDLAWRERSTVHVAEVKSITEGNCEKQLRLGLGQVLRYRHLLAMRFPRVTPWLVPERMPHDPSWAVTCKDVGVNLLAL